MDIFDTSVPEVPGAGTALPQKAAVYGKWLWVYFWMRFVPLVPGFMVALSALSGSSTVPGEVLSLAFVAFDVYILYILGRQEPRFHTCAGLRLISLCVGAAITLLRSEVLFDLWTGPSEILTLIVEYQFMHGCREILLGIDNDLARKWHTLWKWHLGLLIGVLVGIIPLIILVVFLENDLAAIVALIVMLGILAALITVGVLNLVYLYRTANIFRRFCRAAEQRGPEHFA